MDVKYCKLLLLENGLEITEYMNIAPDIGSLCSIYYLEKPFRVEVVDKKLSPDKEGYWVTLKLAPGEEKLLSR